MVRLLKIVVIGSMLVLSAIALFEMVVVPWNIVVTRDYFWAVSLGSSVCVFLCSCAEISISVTKDSDITEWAEREPPTRLRQGLERYARIVTGQQGLFNAIVILANTAVLVIYMTILTPAYIDSNNNNAPAFTGVGITLALFLLAELIPKQIAIKHGMATVIGTSWWVLLISIPLFLPAYGLATPVRWLLDRIT
jgi:CBS domain containing-hemolysin-like protein